MGLFYTHKNPAAYIVLAVSGCIHSAKIQKKMCIHFQPDCLSFSLSVSGILMVSMNNILQVSSRSSLALPRRKLSNSRQVIPLRSLECSKSCSERFIVNGGKKTCKEEETHFAIKMRLQPQVNINALPSRLRLCLI